MEIDLNTKRPWRTNRTDRRIKDGSPEDRKNTADVLRRGKNIMRLEMKPPGELVSWLPFLSYIIIVFMVILWCAIGHTQEINLFIIADIESSGEPLAHNPVSGAVGEYQLMQGVITEWNNRLETHSKSFEIDSLGTLTEHYSLNDMYDENKSHAVADWYLNKKIPQYLKRYAIPDTITSRLISYNWGIGHLRKWFKHGAQWNKLPAETRNYIKKYFREVNQ